MNRSGINHSCDKPLLYLCDLKYQSLGFEEKKVVYQSKQKEFHANSLLEQVANIQWDSYSEIVFVSKSFGMVVAGWLAKTLHLKVKHVFLTPLPETLPYLIGDGSVLGVAVGTKDTYIEYHKVQSVCEKKEYNMSLFQG